MLVEEDEQDRGVDGMVEQVMTASFDSFYQLF